MIQYIGVDDESLDLFEGQYALPDGMCYNSYLVSGKKTAVMDTVDPRATDEWMNNLRLALVGKTPDYLVVQHMEPDHSGSIAAFLRVYPDVTIICSRAAVAMLSNFGIATEKVQVVAEGDVLDLEGATLRFIAAPMVHWPEVIMSYCPEEKTLFSADGFGKFGVKDADADDWACEARRYYFNICGKYGAQVSAVLCKAAALDIATICPLHGPVLEGEKMAEALRLYTIWSAYDVETEGVLIAHASIHGNTAKAAEKLADIFREKTAGKSFKVAITDLTRDDMAEAIEDAFRMGRLVVCASSYDANVFPPMHNFLWKLGMKGYQRRRVGIVENGSWAPSAARAMRELIAPMKDIELIEPAVTIRGALKPTDIPALEALADAMLK